MRRRRRPIRWTTTIAPYSAAVVVLIVFGQVGGASTTRSTPEVAGAVSPAPPDVSPDFVRDVRPILSHHCFACHGPDEAARKAELSLVTFESATAARESDIRAIVPGDVEGSELWVRINDQLEPMPPIEAHNPLNDEQIDVLRRWIEHGASYAPHWAYVPPRATEPPPVRETDWPATTVDRYILARLEQEGLSHAVDADPSTLIRRLTFDLTGMPPRPSDIDAYRLDASSDAYEKVVNRLLSSPHFGERMAMYWLDLVRYADTVGYHGDQTHRIWPYREYVINAFNENLPFDQFTIEQLAGDLLPKPTQNQLVATGYNRVLQTSHEGGVQLKEYRAIYQADRIRNVSGAWMGATVGCAQCHDHKYDPYTTHDFYSLGAFFADIDDEEHLRNPYGGLNTLPSARLPEMRVWSAAARGKQEQLASRRAVLEGELRAATDKLPASRDAWEQELLDALDASAPREFVWVDDRLDTGGTTQGDWTFVREDDVRPYSGEAYRRQVSDGLIQHYSVDTTEKRIQVAEGDVFFGWVYFSQATSPKAMMLQFNVKGDWQHRAVWGGDEIPYGRRSPDWQGYRRQGDLPGPGDWRRLEVRAEDVGLKPGDIVSGIAFTQFGGTVYWDKAGVSSSQLAPTDVVEAIRTSAADRTEQQNEVLIAYHEQTAPAMTEIRTRMADVDRELAELESSLPLTMYTQSLSEPREVRVLPRGNWLNESGEVVQPAIPAFLGSLAVEGRASRLDLARWLVTPQAQGGVGELTARVFVNRVWALLFGEGLCPSLDDFGGQGRPPVHPELLDRLALEFVDSGWNVKSLIRSLVMTRTYRQSSVAHADVLQRDPKNYLFARQTRRRLPAEMVRDTALAVSGLLVDDIGGPSVNPPQPAGLYRHLNFPKREYEADRAPQQYRRGLYVHWQRQYLHPMLTAFDAPTREECTARRPTSNTPLAALTLLNDPVFVEASRQFAQRVLLEGGADDRSRITFAFREATGRRPHGPESDVLETLLRESLREYSAAPELAAQLLGIGDSPRDESLDAPTLAAWTQVTRAILNLHETITRE